MLGTAGAAAIAVAGVVAWALHAGEGRNLISLFSPPKPIEVASLAAPEHLAGRPSVAILPFRNLSADTGHDFFSDGITEDVITALSRFSNLLVVSKSASFPFKDLNASPADIGRSLGARYLLTGSIRRAGNRVRVSVELTEAATARIVWSETYDAEGDDIFAVQDKIAKRVVGAATVKLTRFEEERVLAKPTGNVVVYEYVLRGRGAMSHATRESNDEASGLFQRAIDLDPNYAEAYAALGGSHYEAVVSGWTEFRSDELELAESLAQKALALDPTNTRAYRVLALIHLSGNATTSRSHKSIARWRSIRAMRTILPIVGPSSCGRAKRRRLCRGWKAPCAPTGQRLRSRQALHGLLSAAPVHRGRRRLRPCPSRNPGRSDQMIAHPLLAAVYAELGRQQDADKERAITMRLWPFLDARTFAAQFGTEEARNQMLDGLEKAGFH